jgi:hypothetical protein
MQGIYYLLSIIAVAAVIQWFIQNDRRSNDEPTVGILKMPVPRKKDDPGRAL